MRDEHIRRGDESSVQQHANNMARIGVVQEIGGGPFIVQHEDHQDVFPVLHWASRLEALERLVVQQKKHETNRALQLALKSGIKVARLYAHSLPLWGRLFLVVLGNLGNNSATVTTIFEKMEATTMVDGVFSKKWKSLQKQGSQSQRRHDDTKWDMVSALRPGWWPNYRCYEITVVAYSKLCATLFMDTANKTAAGTDVVPAASAASDAAAPAQAVPISAYEALRQQAFKSADLHAMTLADQVTCFKFIHGICGSLLQQYPAEAVGVMLLSFPRHGSLGRQPPLVDHCSQLPS